jgi:hypothetical protein
MVAAEPLEYVVIKDLAYVLLLKAPASVTVYLVHKCL